MITSERSQIELLLDVARRYWERGQDQREIAAAIGYSRPTVSRLLAEARRRGVVTITISHPQERMIEIETALRDRYGLRDARVASAGATAGVAAQLLGERLERSSVLAISNGLAVAAVVAAMPRLRLPASRTVQMIGAVGHSDLPWDSPETCRNMAAALGGRYNALPVPLIVRSANVAAALRQESQVAATLELAARADIALLGVGAVCDGRSGHIFAGHEGPDLAAAIRASAAVGHVCGHHIDIDGRPVGTPLRARTIAVDPARLRSIALTIGVAWGPEKVTPLRAAMTGGYLSCLVTDEQTALALL